MGPGAVACAAKRNSSLTSAFRTKKALTGPCWNSKWPGRWYKSNCKQSKRHLDNSSSVFFVGALCRAASLEKLKSAEHIFRQTVIFDFVAFGTSLSGRSRHRAYELRNSVRGFARQLVSSDCSALFCLRSVNRSVSTP